jgi:hypothetical protein
MGNCFYKSIYNLPRGGEMKSIFCGKMLIIAVGVILVLTTFAVAIAQEKGEVSTLVRMPPVVHEPDSLSLLSTSTAPGYCASTGGSHEYEYILDAQYTQMTEDTISITVEIYIANPTACESGEPCPEYDNSPEFINAWIDWNGDKVFEDSERVLDVDLTGYLGINYSGTMSTSTIVSIPEDSVDFTWMRVNLGWSPDDPPVDPCEDPCTSSWTWGDIMDREVVPRIAVPRIDEINVTGIPDANNPMTSDTSVAGAERVRLEAVIIEEAGYEVLDVSWSGDILAGVGNPYEYIPDAGSHGMKYVMCAITYKDTTTLDTWTDTKGRNFKLFFSKEGNDNGDSEPNWFEYWKADGAVPNMDQFLYDPAAAWYGCYCSGELYLGSIAAGQHYGSAIELDTYFGTESFGGPTVKGVDSVAEIIGHELYHLWVREQWESGGDFHGQDDSDEGVPCDDCDDNLPDNYEENTSHTDPDVETDTYDLEHVKHSDYERYGDNEYMAMRAGNGSRGIAIRDWANPGKQSDPPDGCHSLGDYAPVHAQLTGYYTDAGVDVDGDSLYDYLRVQAELHVTAGGIFRISARLMDQSSNELTWLNKNLILYPGSHLIALDFDGLDIRQTSVNGPYRVSIFVGDDEGLAVDDGPDVYETAAYAYGNFEQRDANFSDGYLDYGVDADADGSYDTLTIQVDVNVITPKTYLVEGGLYDSLGNAIEIANVSADLNAGAQTINLDFDGEAIRRNRVNGPFFLWYLSLSGSPQIDFILDAHTTQTYNFTDFEKTDASFTGSYSDHGNDTDSDGAFNYLTVEVGVDVVTAGNYSLTGWLYDSDGKIVQASKSASLATGVQTIHLDFDGASIYLNGVDGLYYLKYLTLFNGTGALMDTLNDAYTTSAYSYSAFQRPLIGLTGSYSDYGTDEDSDGKFDKLTVEMGVHLSSPGWCVAKARLTDANEEEIAWAEKIVFFDSDGPQTIQLDFAGETIYNHGVDGPYYLSDVYIYHAGDPFQPAYVNEAYTTFAYNYCQFGNCPPVADAGPDQTVMVNSGCMASVDLDGSGSFDPEGDPIGSYTWTWSVDGTPNSATGVTPNISLPLGVHTIALVVDAGTMSSEPDTVVITVIDNTPPSISVSVTPDTLWSPNHKMKTVNATVSVSDNCDTAPEIVLISVTCNEPDNDPLDGDGNTTNDVQGADIGTEDYEIWLRSERNEDGTGRIYTITYMAVDNSGNTATANATVTVPVRE